MAQDLDAELDDLELRKNLGIHPRWSDPAAVGAAAHAPPAPPPALQHLPGTQRAVLILREVLDFSAAEVASILDTTTASVNSALQRARSSQRLNPKQTPQIRLRRSAGVAPSGA